MKERKQQMPLRCDATKAYTDALHHSAKIIDKSIGQLVTLNIAP